MIRTTSIICLLAAGCSAPDANRLFNQVDITVVEGSNASNDAFVELIDQTEFDLAIALPSGTDTELSNAIEDAHLRGVSVELVLDYDQRDDEGFAALIDAGVPYKLADDGLEYFEFNFNEDVGWSSDQTIMSSALACSALTRPSFAKSSVIIHTEDLAR